MSAFQVVLKGARSSARVYMVHQETSSKPTLLINDHKVNNQYIYFAKIDKQMYSSDKNQLMYL